METRKITNTKAFGKRSSIMKRLIKLMVLAASAASLFACQVKEIISDPVDMLDDHEGMVLQKFNAVSETTKTTINGSYQTLWAKDDEIKVYWDGGNGTATLEGEGGATSGTFTGWLPDGKTGSYAVYPRSAAAGVDGTTVSVTIPAAQTGTFGGGNIATAKIEADNDMSFRNVNAFLSVVTSSSTHHVVVESVGGQALVGTVPVSYADPMAPALGEATSTASSVSMTAGDAGTYYISILPGITHSKGLKITYYSDETTIAGTYFLNKSVATARNEILEFGTMQLTKDYYVTVDGGATVKNGLSWATAFSKDQMWNMVTLASAGGDDAKEAALLDAIDGATFHLGHGTYNLAADPTLSFSGDVVTLTFKGGYPAAGGARDLASYRADFTGNDEHACLILRGKLDVTFDGIGFVHGYVNADETASLDCNGTAAGSDITVSLSDCVVENCVNGGYSSQTDQWGAGLLLKGVTSFTAENVTFSNNKSYAVAAAYVHSTDATFTNCSFSYNSAYERAGAVYVNVSDSGSASFESCTFSGNEAETNRGGAMFINGGNCTLTTCTFSNNIASTDGGAICINKGLLTVAGGTFSGNSANYGGAIIAEKDGADVGLKILKSGGNKTSFINNSAGTQGGAIWGATQSTSSDKNVSIQDAIFKGNHAPDGGACYVHGSSNTGMYFYRCTFGGAESGEPNYATTNGGSIFLNSKCNTTIQNSTITGDYAGNFGGAIYVNNTSGNCIVEGGTIDGCHAKYGGAIGTKTGSHVTIDVNGVTISNCHSRQGGAAMLRGTGTFRTDVYNDAGTQFVGNYIDQEDENNRGGAIKLENGASVKIFRSSFIGNHAPYGGALYSASNSKDSNIFIDETSFDANYITMRWGPAIALDGANMFCMNNCSIRGSYTTTSTAADQQDLKPSWVCIDGIKDGGSVSLSNMTIIGNPQYSADGSSFTPLTTNTALVAVWGTQTNYFTNCIIVPESAGIAAIRGDGDELIDMYYTHYSSVGGIGTNTNSGGNTTGLDMSDLGSLSWSNDESVSYYWKWDGKISGSAPSKASQSAITSRLSTICSTFTDWLGGDLNKDQRYVGRGDGQWWPGAYQTDI